jgi:Icc-related predicted phosphoesterase
VPPPNLFRRRGQDHSYTLFFSTDLHGSEKCFLKFLNAARFYHADGLVLGGDLTGKGFVPIIERGGRHHADFLGRRESVETEAELADLEKQVRFNGFYPYRCSQEEFDRLKSDPDHRAGVFRAVTRAEVERWVSIADERVAAAGVPCVMMAGNDDDPIVDEVLERARVVRHIDGGLGELGPYTLLGFGYSNPTPWNSPRELPEEEIESRLRELVRGLDDPRLAVFNVHVPPHNSSLDLAPKLRADLSFATTGSQPHTVPVGSTAVRRVIEDCQPLLALHGHVHESKAATTIGSTVCLNPGSEYNNGVLRGALVHLKADRVVRHQFVSG